MQVVDLQFFATPRITLKPLVPSFPCFANIYVSLMDKVLHTGKVKKLTQQRKSALIDVLVPSIDEVVCLFLLYLRGSSFCLNPAL